MRTVSVCKDRCSCFCADWAKETKQSFSHSKEEIKPQSWAEGQESRSSPGTAPTQLLPLEGCSGTRWTSSPELSAYSLVGKSRDGSLPLAHESNPLKPATLSFTTDLQTLLRQTTLYFLIFPPLSLFLQFQGCQLVTNVQNWGWTLEDGV